MKIIKIITMVAIIVFISLSKKSLLPKGKEIDNIEVLKLVGLDYNKESEEEKAILSFMMEKEEGGIESQDQSKKEYQQVMTYKEVSFTEAIRKIEFYSDKNMAGSHIKYFLIGEETAKNNIDDALDIISKDQEVRMSGHIYLIKGSTSKVFLEEMVSSEYKLSEKLQSMEEKSSQKSIVNYLSFSDLLAKKLSKPGVYLVPTLVVDASEKLTEVKGGENEEDKTLEKSFGFYGYGIMKDTKLACYIDSDEAIIYNMLINKSEGGNIDIENKKGEVLSFGLNDISTDYSFKFNKDKLEYVNISVNFRSNYEEVHTKEDIVYSDDINKYERLQEEKIRKQAEKLIEKSQRLGLDIIGIGQKIKLKHPYKYRNIKNTFEEDYKTLDINVKVNASIDRTYDMVKIN